MKRINLETSSSKFFQGDVRLKSYLDEIRKTPVMTKEEEYDAFSRYNNGDTSAYDEIIKANQRAVFKMAIDMAPNNSVVMDLVNEGNIGLIQAIKTYDYKSGNKFLSYAVWYVKREMSSFLRNQGELVRKSNISKTYYKVKDIKNNFFNEEHRMPEPWEIIDILKDKYGIVIKDENDLLDVSCDSLDMSLDSDDEFTLENSSSFNEKTYTENEYEDEVDDDYNKRLVKRLLSGFKEREQKIIKMAFGLGEYNNSPMNLLDIAEEMDLTPERVRQIKSEAVAKMRLMYKKLATEAI